LHNQFFVLYRQQTEQDMQTFSRDFVVHNSSSDDPHKILEEEAKALAQFNKVWTIDRD
jgi:hypothetical protein